MIAVFSSKQQFDYLNCSPKGIFIKINRPDDVFGRVFIGVVQIGITWYQDEQKQEAYGLLQKRNPKIFKK